MPSFKILDEKTKALDHISKYLLTLEWEEKDPPNLVLSSSKDMNLLHQTLKELINTETAFIYLSTSKLYDPKEIKFETQTRLIADYTDEKTKVGYSPEWSKDQVRTLACDAFASEYCKSNLINGAVFRMGCVVGYPLDTNPDGFLCHMIKKLKNSEPYEVYGHRGKQVRDQLHYEDLCEAILCFYYQTKYGKKRLGEIYNIGGGQANSISVIELIDSLGVCYQKNEVNFHNDSVDHRPYYVTDFTKFHSEFNWSPSIHLDQIIGRYMNKPLRSDYETENSI